jgi:O-methyltransferase
MGLTKSLLKPLFSLLPDPVQSWVRTQRHVRTSVKQNIAAVKRGHRLVPEAELEQKYVEALTEICPPGSSPSTLGDYLEFGVYNGSSLACAFNALNRVNAIHTRLFGFDSFEGLPQEASTDDEGVWYPGEFRMDYKFTRRFLTAKGVDWNRVSLVKGWFKDTLNDATVRQYGIRKASLIMIDCDIYSSAKDALSFCASLIGEQAVIFFDDWAGLAAKNLGEKRAFEEFLAAHPEFTVRQFGTYSPNSQVFIVSRGR